jgi:hypothetical protein
MSTSSARCSPGHGWRPHRPSDIASGQRARPSGPAEHLEALCEHRQRGGLLLIGGEPDEPERGGPGRGLRPVRHPLPVPSRLLPRTGPESKGGVENLVGYAKDDLLVPLELDDDPWAGGLAGLNERAVAHRRPLERPRRRSRAQTTSRQRQRWPRRLLALSPRSRTATSSPDPLHQRCDPARRIVPPEEPHQLKQRRVGTFSWPPQLGR